MRSANTTTPWTFLEEYRGKLYHGEWPTLPELFRITTARHGERPCFTIFDPGKISLNYREALRLVEAVARWLHSKGIRKDDKVAVTGKNIPEWTVAYLGVLFAGATVVPIDVQLKTEEVENLVAASKARILFTDEEKFQRFVDTPGRLEQIISLKKGLGTYVYDLDGPAAEIEEVGEQELAAILFTSGTMGNPKGVMLTHQNLVSDCFLSQGTPLDVLYTDVFYALLPLHHAYTMLAVFIESISQGAELVFGKKMVTQVILKDLKQGKITMFLGVPMLFNKLLAGILRGIRQKGPVAYGLISFLMGISGFIKKVFKVNPGGKMFHAILEKASLTTLRICICGGGPLAPSVFKKYNQLGIDFVQGYGLTEASPITNINPVNHYKETSVGKVIPGIDMKILDPDERGIGEVAVKGPVVMQGYFEMPEETAASFTSDGYLKTGDLGYMDDEAYLYLTGRAKNMLVTEGGKNVYPEEIENEFQLYEEIEQILVRGFIQDEKMKVEGIEALVYPAPEQFGGSAETGPTAPKEAVRARIEAIIAEVNQRLRPYQRIERTVILDKAMEMTTTKKIKRDSISA
ncbi:MAG: AMP-binding protein [Spirochaetaceae bacterium]|jgi:long-chain acyl-CoA synthetase|nr:AMP-binding protein [Spirochaetaceae bacterium]